MRERKGLLWEDAGGVGDGEMGGKKERKVMGVAWMVGNGAVVGGEVGNKVGGGMEVGGVYKVMDSIRIGEGVEGRVGSDAWGNGSDYDGRSGGGVERGGEGKGEL